MSLTKISIPSSVTIIEESAFYLCSSLIHVSMPYSMKSIGQSAFKECTSLTGIIIPFGLHSIEDNVFDSCRSLKEITIPSSVTSIGNYSFAHCSLLMQVEIPSSVVSIESYSFAFCTSLQNISIPSSVNKIENHAFANCNSLRKALIPSSIKKIGIDTFEGCYNMEASDSYFQSLEFKTFQSIFHGPLNVFVFCYCFLGIAIISWWSKIYPWFEHGYKSGKKVYKLLETSWISLILMLAFYVVFKIIGIKFIKTTMNIRQYTKRYIIFIIIRFVVFISLYIIITVCTRIAVSYARKKGVIEGETVNCFNFFVEGTEGARDWAYNQSEKTKKKFDKWYQNKISDLKNSKINDFCLLSDISYLTVLVPLAFYLLVLVFVCFSKCIFKCKNRNH